MSKIILKGHIVVPRADLAEVKRALPTHIELTRNESGCLLFQVTQDADDECVFQVYEEFTDRSSFESHKDRVRSSAWGAITSSVERHYQISEVAASE